MNARRILSALLALSLCAATHAQDNNAPLRYNVEAETDLAVGLWAIPFPIDYDGDGLKDLVVSAPDTPYKGLYFFRNIGTASQPFFDKAVKISKEGRDNISYCELNGAPHFLAPGVEFMHFADSLYSCPSAIEYSGERIGAGYKHSRSNKWKYVDWDNDGDVDIVVGIDCWDDYGWHNAYDERGRWKNGPLHAFLFLLENVDGQYINRGKIQAGGVDIDLYGAPNPCIADFDGDGDLDIICGEFVDGLTWFENVGTRESPVFAPGRSLCNKKGERIAFHVQMIVPVCTDFDGDGYPDLIVGDEDGRVAWLRNTGGLSHSMPIFEGPIYFRQKADLVKFGALSTPCCVDWDGDGRLDIVSGNSAGEIALIRNISEGKDLSWAEPELLTVKGEPFRIMAGESGSIQGPAERKWGYTTLSAGDFNGDGRCDVVFNSIIGQVQWMAGKSGIRMSKPRPVYVLWEGDTPKPAWTWWQPEKGTLVTQWRTTPVMIDWNGDGLDDLIIMDTEGYLSYYERVPSSRRKLVFRPGKRIFYCINCSVYNNVRQVVDPAPGLLRLNDAKAGPSGRRKYCFMDWDGDGLLDLIVDSHNASWFRNLGTKEGVTYLEYKGEISDLKLAGHSTSPTPFYRGEGATPGLLLGGEDGHFYFIEKE